nr:AbrB/MazE/SpoVT family DNA-binding domain-containing protein [Endozoicomonas sp.]
MNTTIRKIGNSSGAIIPSELLRRMNLQEGDAITISEERNSLVITKARPRPRYTMDELMAQCDTEAAMPEELSEWDSMPPAGDEVL